VANVHVSPPERNLVRRYLRSASDVFLGDPTLISRFSVLGQVTVQLDCGLWLFPSYPGITEGFFSSMRTGFLTGVSFLWSFLPNRGRSRDGFTPNFSFLTKFPFQNVLSFILFLPLPVVYLPSPSTKIFLCIIVFIPPLSQSEEKRFFPP